MHDPQTLIPQNTIRMSATALIDRTHCPLCGQPNRCAMELASASGQPQPPCWCTEVDFSPVLLDRVPAATRGQACICRACAERAGTSGVS